jgi:hypothetical protein
MRTAVHYLPILTTFLSVVFAKRLHDHWRVNRSPHVGWWTVGVFFFGLGTFVESWTTIFGWQEWSFRTWYITGALLGGAPLAQGTIYLLFSRRSANRLTFVLIAGVLIAMVCVLSSPIDYGLVEPHRLTGKVLAWKWVRMFSPFINTYAFFGLVGGAIWSAIQYKRAPEFRNRFLANVWIAIGGILPGIGGAFTRFGYTEVLYTTELIGLSLIFFGYSRYNAQLAPSIVHTASAIETR